VYGGYESYRSWRWCVGIVIIHTFGCREWLRVVCMLGMSHTGLGGGVCFYHFCVFRIVSSKMRLLDSSICILLDNRLAILHL
jgi:hypothetical protein